MPMPDLESLEGTMNRACMDALGDSIVYTALSGSAVTRGYVDYRDGLRDLSTGTVIEQDITVAVLIADVPAKPSSGCRITLGKVPGLVFKPVAPRRDESGDHWEFELERVNA